MKSLWKNRKMWIILVTTCGLLLTVLVVLWGIHNSVIAAGQDKVFNVDDDIPPARVALVLGAKVYQDGSLSPVLADRVDTAVELYKRGVVEKLLMSGDNRTDNYNEVTAMRDYAVRNGVPSDDVVRDFAGFRTYDSIFRAKELWNLDEMIIVSQRFHLPRSIYIAESLGVKATGVIAKGRYYPVSLKRASQREIGARLLAWIDVLVGRDPYFLGPKETLSGDSQVTRVQE